MIAAANNTPIYLHSIFCSIQGEGIYLGYPQIFIRLSGCNLNCAYCDTPDALTHKPYALIEQKPFSGLFNKFRNPAGPDFVRQQVSRLIRLYPEFHSISLTGGEPLLQTDSLLNILPVLKKERLPVFLETNGTLPDELQRIIRWIDIISMDIKTTSTTHKEINWDNTRRFLESAARKKVYVKVLVDARPNITELKQIRGLVSRIDKNIPVVLQPLWPVRKQTLSALVTSTHLLQQKLSDVRIIPQMHKLMGWR